MKLLNLTLGLVCALALRPAMATPPPTTAPAQEGHGGAGVCINGKCMTLAEAGFRLVTPQSDTVEVGPEVIEELRHMASLIPPFAYGNHFDILPFDVSKIIGEPKDIQFVTSVDPKVTESFLKRYKEVLNTNNGQSYSNIIQIIGFTVRDQSYGNHYTTYIIQDQYDQLTTTRSKALLLKHESSLRQGRSLDEALRIDGALVDFLAAKESNNWNNFDTWKFLKTVYAQDVIESLIIGDILHRVGDLKKEDFCGESHSYDCALDYAKILENNKYDPRLSSYILPGAVEIRGLSRGGILYNYIFFKINNLESSGSTTHQFSITKKDFDNYVRSLQKDKDRYNNIDMLKSCKNVSDTTELLHANQYVDIFYYPELISCKTQLLTSYYNTFNTLEQYMYGLELNIPGKLVCNYNSAIKGSLDDQLQCHLEK